MFETEKQIYISMVDKLISSNLITQRLGDQLKQMLEDKKYIYKVKKHISDLLSLLSSIESMNQ
jgi:hypothetical protein